ncbi:hypothetical protein DFH29DRAFT_851950 [Suillus ampliporus]|nr:hypothetical protein DFH29DRAFT_851950 [Suillus ampliporus]
MEAEYSGESVDLQRNTYSHQEVNNGQMDSDVPTSLLASTRCMIVISELRWKIFQFVGHTMSWVPSARNESLLALALTCKSFTGPALDLLWEELCGLAPLIRCLPQSLWKEGKQKLEFQRAMTFDDWSIFCKYNHRVRSLDTEYDWVTPLDIEILRALSCPPFSPPLLPNLRSLAWGETTSETFLYIWLFVTPKLTTLNISRESLTFGPSEQSILSCISMLCPSISHFGFDSFKGSEDTSTALQCWSHLKSVKTGRISEAAILHLSNLPSLCVLHFQLPSTPISANTQKLLQRPVFCALRELDVTCEGSLALLDAFFEKLSIAPKAIHCVITHAVDSPRTLPALISRISNTCDHSSMEQVQFSITDRPADHIASIGAAAFQPLFAFRNLRSLSFRANYSVRLDDAVLLQMAKAWPLLGELFFSASYNLSHDVTPHAFVSLLQHCPRLFSVAVFINWSTIDRHDISPVIPYQGFSHKTLSRVYFGSPRIGHPTRIAAFISAIAPNVGLIDAWDPDLHEDHPDFEKYSARWKLVQRLVESFSMVREQERRTKLKAGAGAHEEFRGPFVEVGGEVGGGDEDEDEDEDEEEDSGSEGEYTDQASSDSEEEE